MGPGHGVFHMFLTLMHPSEHDFLRAVLGVSEATAVSQPILRLQPSPLERHGAQETSVDFE